MITHGTKQWTVEDWEVALRTRDSKLKPTISTGVRRLLNGESLSSSMHNLLEAALNTGDL